MRERREGEWEPVGRTMRSVHRRRLVRRFRRETAACRLLPWRPPARAAASGRALEDLSEVPPFRARTECGGCQGEQSSAVHDCRSKPTIFRSRSPGPEPQNFNIRSPWRRENDDTPLPIDKHDSGNGPGRATGRPPKVPTLQFSGDAVRSTDTRRSKDLHQSSTRSGLGSAAAPLCLKSADRRALGWKPGRSPTRQVPIRPNH